MADERHAATEGGGTTPGAGPRTGDVTLPLPLLTELLDGIGDALLFVGVPAGRVLHANGSAATLLGRRRAADVVGARIESIDPGLEAFGLLRLAATLRETPAGRVRRDSAWLRADGHLVPVEVSVRRALLDGEEYHICVARDVSDRRRAEAEARRRYEELFRIFNGLGAAVFVVDPDDCRVLAVNDYARRRFGAERGLHCAAAARPRGEGACPCGRHARVEAAAATDEPLVWEFQHGDGRWYRCIETALPWTEGRTVRLEATFDVTDERRLHEQLRQAQKMEALGRLAGGVAHDFNNILNGILGFTTLLRDRPGLDAEASEHLDAIARSALRGATLTGRVLGFARRTPPNIAPTDLVAAANDAVRLVSMTAPPSVRLALDAPRDLWPARADAAQFEQVVLNLCVNAVDAMPAGGELDVQLSNVRTRRPLRTLHTDLPPGRYVRLRVRDRGVGMAPEDVARVFEPFYSTKTRRPNEDHSGLGLSIVWGVVAGHGGGLRVRSRPQRGTSFEIYLPAAAGSDRPTSVAPPTPSRGHGELVLVVDDEPTNVELAGIVLERHGYRVVTAADGAEAVERFAAHAGDVSLVLLDLVMPRMDGAEAWRRIRALRDDVPVLFTSGFDAEGVSRQVSAEGRTDFLAKPYEPKTLLARVEQALRRAGPDGGA